MRVPWCHIIWRLIWLVPVGVSFVLLILIYAIKEGPGAASELASRIW